MTVCFLNLLFELEATMFVVVFSGHRRKKYFFTPLPVERRITCLPVPEGTKKQRTCPPSRSSSGHTRSARNGFNISTNITYNRTNHSYTFIIQKLSLFLSHCNHHQLINIACFYSCFDQHRTPKSSSTTRSDRRLTLNV